MYLCCAYTSIYITATTPDENDTLRLELASLKEQVEACKAAHTAIAAQLSVECDATLQLRSALYEMAVGVAILYISKGAMTKKKQFKHNTQVHAVLASQGVIEPTDEPTGDAIGIILLGKACKGVDVMATHPGMEHEDFFCRCPHTVGGQYWVPVIDFVRFKDARPLEYGVAPHSVSSMGVKMDQLDMRHLGASAISTVERVMLHSHKYRVEQFASGRKLAVDYPDSFIVPALAVRNPEGTMLVHHIKRYESRSLKIMRMIQQIQK